MAEKKQIGVFWGREKIYFVKTLANHPGQLFSLPFEHQDLEFKVKDGVSSNEIPITATIKNSLKHEKIDIPSTVNLALPIKDIIFRSFVIPWMLPNELRGVVEFEASRYVPFSLDELSFSFHPTTIMEDGTRRIRIVFVAIKKDTLNTYINILERSKLSIGVVEPAPLSLIRVLSIKGLIDPEQTIALVEKDDKMGKIIILDKGIPQFVREFQLTPPSPDGSSPALNSEMAFNRLINEVRVCIDYFNRQDASLQVKELCLLSSNITDEQASSLSEDMDLNILPIDISSILEHTDYTDSAYLNSFGSALVETKDHPAIFDLSTTEKDSSGRTAMPSWNDLSLYKTVLITLIVCVLLCFGSFWISNKMSTKYNSKISNLKEKMGIYSGAPIDSLQSQHDELEEKMNTFKKLFVKSDITFFLVKISNTLPNSAWLKSFNAIYSTTADNLTKPQINIDGYIYQEKTQEQFRIINLLLTNFKEDAILKDTFSEVTLSSIRSEKINGNNVTYFKINFNQL